MFLIITRNFPPDIGGMQILMGGLSESLLDHGPVKVFAYEHIDSDLYDKKTSVDIERIKGIKLLRKYRKANIVNEFINKNSNIRVIDSSINPMIANLGPQVLVDRASDDSSGDQARLNGYDFACMNMLDKWKLKSKGIIRGIIQ